MSYTITWPVRGDDGGSVMHTTDAPVELSEAEDMTRVKSEDFRYAELSNGDTVLARYFDGQRGTT